MKGNCVVIMEDGGIAPMEIEFTLDNFQAIVGGDIEALPYPGRDDVTAYIHAEGKFECGINEVATMLMSEILWADDFIAGPILICGFDPETGEEESLPEDVATELTSLYNE